MEWGSAVVEDPRIFMGLISISEVLGNSNGATTKTMLTLKGPFKSMNPYSNCMALASKIIDNIRFMTEKHHQAVNLAINLLTTFRAQPQLFPHHNCFQFIMVQVDVCFSRLAGRTQRFLCVRASVCESVCV